jgi:hypothetical protein
MQQPFGLAFQARSDENLFSFRWTSGAALDKVFAVPNQQFF